MPVRLLDAKAGTWSTIECTAEEGDDLPRPRGGHSVRAVGDACPAFKWPQASMRVCAEQRQAGTACERDLQGACWELAGINRAVRSGSTR